MCGLIHYILDNAVHLCTADSDRLSSRHYRDYTLNITCRTADWGIFIIYDDFRNAVSHDFRFCAQYSLS